jgi:SAM-dependent methyltransferase
MTDDELAPITRARALRSPGEAIATYRDWAATYDRDVYERLGFTGTDRIADLLAEHVADRSTPVVDLGAGTGAAARRLRTHGFTTIDAIDISFEMLAVAGRHELYDGMVVADLTEPLPVANGRYGASVSAGTFTSGHVGAGAVDEITRIHRAGAVLAWVIAGAMWDEFAPALAAAGVELWHHSYETIRRRGEPEAHMIVGQVSPEPPRHP